MEEEVVAGTHGKGTNVTVSETHALLEELDIIVP